jgi:shikimate dehydrogenase
VSRNQANQPNHITYELLDQQIMNEYTIIINASPVGMTPNEIEYPNIPYDYIGENHLLYDLIYKPEQTIFLKQGLDRGAVVKNGFEMLLIQAEENWKIWNQ